MLSLVYCGTCAANWHTYFSNLSFCACLLAPLALALAGTTFSLCAVVIGYFEVFICNFAAHHVSKEPVDDFVPQLYTLTSNQRCIVSNIRDYFLCMHTL